MPGRRLDSSLTQAQTPATRGRHERMLTTRAVIVASLALAIASVLAPAVALATGGRGGAHSGPSMSTGGPPRGGGRGGPHGFRSAVPHAGISGKWPAHGLRPGPGGRPFPCCAGGSVWGGFPYYGSVWYAPPPTYYYPSTYDHPPTYYYASAPPLYTYPPAYAAPTVDAPRPTVVEYPHGRYELRGDGVTTPYTWVWIPTAPPPPPPPEEPAAPPADASGSEAPSPARPGPVYRWTDEQGVVHWTDRVDTVPVQHRTQALQPG